MNRLVVVGALFLVLLLSIDAAACEDDGDCPPAARCVKTTGEWDGICQRDLRPAPATRNAPSTTPGRAKGTEGQRCEFGGDCVEGLYCMPSSNPDVRVCRRY